ncbi:MAG: hypothetical protein GC191_13070 [Azospirillum sp.]|nr:hypothetical protein [Azospirillum sp.]
MTDTTGKAPLARMSDGALVLKVWEQPGGQNGKPFLTTSVERTYRDRETGEYRTSHSLTRGQLLKLPALAMEASNFIRDWEAERRKEGRQQDGAERPQGGLAAQRDQAMANAKAPEPVRQTSPDMSPEH